MAATSTAGGMEGGIPQRAREQRLVAALRQARGRGRASVTEGALFVAGGALSVLGLLLIIVGWVGTSHTVLVAGQIPYVVSGGLLGVGLVFLGGFLYFAYWMAVLVRENRDRGMQDRADMARMSGSLEQVTTSLATIADLLEANLRAAAVPPQAASAGRLAPGRTARRPRAAGTD